MSHYQIFGGPGSPYSHKIRAVFRYRRIPHTWLVPQGDFSGNGALGSGQSDVNSHLANANKGIVPVVLYPDGSYKADSTPIIYDLESRHLERSIIPPNPAIAFLAHLIEDMADEFLPIPMFHYRWTDDQTWCSRRQMIGWSGALSDEMLESSAQAFLARQVGQLASAAVQREQMDKAYTAFYAAMESMLSSRQFIFGSRPSLAEFALYGQLTQYAVDPTLSSILKDTAIRTYQWTHFMDDLSGTTGDWFEPQQVLDSKLAGLLGLVREFYLPMVTMMTSITGLEDLEESANGMKYRVKTYLDLKRELAALDKNQINLIQPILEQTGCWQGFQFNAGEEEKVIEIRPK